MTQHFHTYRGSQISYFRFGNGPRPALCLHGFGEDGTSFSFLEEHAGNGFTFLAIDLPFHGQTNWEAGTDFLHNDLECIIKNILSENNLLPTGNNPSLTLLGFSLGGRVALSLYQAMPQSIERIVLLAPDGLNINFWYWLSTQSWFGKQLFLFTMKYPGWFFGFVKMVHFFGFVNASIFKFVNFYIGNKEIRRLLYLRWITLRKIKPDLKKIKSFIREYKTHVALVYGKHDHIILPAIGIKFKRGIEDHTSLTIINAGHQVLHAKHINEILPLLIDKKDNP